MNAPNAISTLNQLMQTLDKEDRRRLACKLANAIIQKHPLGTRDPEEQLMMRHLFVHLPVDDIAKYMGNFLLTQDRSKETVKKLWIGEKPMWASTCRMMHTTYNSYAWKNIWQTNARDMGNANAQVMAGMYSVAYDKKYYQGWVDAIDQTDSVWLQPNLFQDWNLVKDETKLKIWMVISSKKDPSLMKHFANAIGWETQWSLAETFLGNDMFHPDHALREISIKQLMRQKNQPKNIELPEMDFSNL